MVEEYEFMGPGVGVYGTRAEVYGTRVEVYGTRSRSL
jgi:hypothetical protein